MKQKAEITFEQEETVVLRQGDCYLLDFCPRCHTTVRLLTPEVMAVLAAVSEREVFRLIELRQIHFIETRRIYVCPGCYETLIQGHRVSNCTTLIGKTDISSNENGKEQLDG